MKNITVDHIIAFLQNDGWNLANSNNKFYFYSPPEKLGFPESYTLPVASPTSKDRLLYDQVLEETLNAVSDIYGEDIHSLIFKVDDYFQTLRQNALYFKLESKDIVFDKTLDIIDIWHFLKNISRSYTSYLKVKFTKDFFGDIINEKDQKFYQSNLSFVNKYSSLRLIDLEYQSFSFGVATDYLMGNDKIKVIDNPGRWRSELLPSFKHDIIDLDLNRDEDVRETLEKFNPDERRAIFQPIIQTLKSENYDVYQTDKSFETKQRLIRPAPSTIDVIIPKKEKEDVPDVSLYQIVLPVDKSKSQLTIKTSSFDNDLFSKKADTINWELNEINYGDSILRFSSPLRIEITYDSDEAEYNVLFDALQIDLTVQNFNDIGSELYSEILTKYFTYQDIIKRDSQFKLTQEEDNIKKFFDKNLKIEE